VSLFHAINYVLDLGPGNVYWPKLSNSALATEEPQLTDFFLPISGPSGSPEFLSDKISTSSTSLSVVWQPPTRSTLNGEFLGYEMTYKVAGASDGRNAKRIRINEDMLRIQVRRGASLLIRICPSVLSRCYERTLYPAMLNEETQNDVRRISSIHGIMHSAAFKFTAFEFSI
jgi:hypothetical protein